MASLAGKPSPLFSNALVIAQVVLCYLISVSLSLEDRLIQNALIACPAHVLLLISSSLGFSTMTLPNPIMIVLIVWVHPLLFFTGPILDHGYVTKKRLFSKSGKSVVISQHSSFLPDFLTESSLYAAVKILIFSTFNYSLRLDYLGPVDFNSGVRSEMDAISDMDSMYSSMHKSYAGTMLGLGSLLVGCIVVLGGVPLLLLALGLAGFFYLADRSVTRSLPNIPTTPQDSRALNMQEGVYRLYQVVAGVQSPVGIGYHTQGTFYTRYHVTQGMSIQPFDDGIRIKPSYVNIPQDNISYGANPQYASVADGEEVLVAAAGRHSRSIILYNTIARRDGSNHLFFRGYKTTPGSSGSPIFKKSVVETVAEDGTRSVRAIYQYAGSLGWTWDRDPDHPNEQRTATQISPVDNLSTPSPLSMPDPKVFHQVFIHPGSGKTRTHMPSLVAQGLNRYGRAVVAAPTRVVATEIYHALLAQNFKDTDVSNLTSSANAFQRGSPASRSIIVSTHQTLLSMLLAGDRVVTKKALWIMDEAHFVNTSSMVFKDYLRHNISLTNSPHEGSSLVELTATGYNTRTGAWEFKDGSNGDILDVPMDVDAMVHHICNITRTEDRPNPKVIVFVTAKQGKSSTTAQSLSTTLRRKGIPTVSLSRETFEHAYPAAKAMEWGVILSTDIAECGANIDGLDAVYDFQVSSKSLYITPTEVRTEPRRIDQAQRVQRRGRIGRTPNTLSYYYHPPGELLPEWDCDRIEYAERRLACESLSIPTLDPPTSNKYSNFILSPAQVITWMSTDEKSPNSPLVVDTFIDSSGFRRSRPDILRKWHSIFNPPLTAGVMLNCARTAFDSMEFDLRFYDQRDHAVFALMSVALKDARPETLKEDADRTMVRSILDRLVDWSHKRPRIHTPLVDP